MKIRSLIVDDETFAAKGLATYVEKIDFLELVGIFHNAIEVNQFLLEHPVDLIFLDIQMPHLTGIEFLRSLDNPPLVVFTTAYTEYAIEGYDLNVIDYLLKPISFDRFLKSANKAFQYKNLIQNNLIKTDDYFFIKSGNKIEKIIIDEILFIESMQNYVQIHTTALKYIALMPLKSVRNFLDQQRFIQPHQSYIVSVDKIESIEGNTLYVAKHQIPISKYLKESILEKILHSRFLKK